jgi:glycyl-tRNA synthetase beta chain
LTHGLRLSIDRVNDAQGLRFGLNGAEPEAAFGAIFAATISDGVFGAKTRKLIEAVSSAPPAWLASAKDHDPTVSDSLRDFLHDRLKVHLREQGLKHDLIDAVLSMPESCDLVLVVMRVQALDAFLKTEDGKNLLAGYKRAANILAAEDKKKQGVAADWVFDPKHLVEPEEKALHAALVKAGANAKKAIAKEDFAAAMTALTALRAPMDSFFDKVLVNADEPALRRNRLLLLAQIRDGLLAVADFSKIEG